MEYMRGGNLTKAVMNHEKLDKKDIAQQIAAALVYLHSRNIIHRDLKGANVLMDSDHKVAKVTDFGLAKLFSSTKNFSNCAAPVGTYNYMAPEVRCIEGSHLLIGSLHR